MSIEERIGDSMVPDDLAGDLAGEKRRAQDERGRGQFPTTRASGVVARVRKDVSRQQNLGGGYESQSARIVVGGAEISRASDDSSSQEPGAISELLRPIESVLRSYAWHQACCEQYRTSNARIKPGSYQEKTLFFPSYDSPTFNAQTGISVVKLTRNELRRHSRTSIWKGQVRAYRSQAGRSFPESCRRGPVWDAPLS